MKNNLIKHEYGFYYTQLENGKIQVTFRELKNYLKNKNIMMSGSEFDEINNLSNSFEYDFTELIKNGTVFRKIDMFGNEHIVTKSELLKFINRNYKH